MPALSSFAQAQPALVEHLRQSLQNKRLHHAFLLVGPTATPLSALALAFAQSLICASRQPNGDACGSCTTCRKVAHGNHADFMHIQKDERGVIPVAVVRRLAQRLNLRAVEAPRKVVYVAEACSMPPAAQNALLKTLEEPPPHTVFVLATPRTGNLLATVRSRCTILHLVAPAHHAAVAHLVEQGVPQDMSELMAPWLGADSEAAQECLDMGASEIVATLQRTLTPGLAASDVFRAAADLGQSPERTELTLTLLEVLVRDGLAHAHGAGAHLLYHPTPQVLPCAHLAAAAEELRRLRRLGAVHLNRPMALEGLFFMLTGAVGSPVP